MTNQTHKLAAIVFTDIVGYTRQMEKDEQLTMQLLQKQRDLIFPLVAAHNGEVIKEIGDGLMLMFNSAVEAVRFAIEAQQRLKDEDLTIRAGIHIGDVIFKDGDVFGSAVNTASRIEPLAQPNGICVSDDVRNQIRNKNIRLISCGKKELKGVGEPLEIFEVFIKGVSIERKLTPVTIFKDLWNRRVFQISAIYLFSAWIIKQAVAAMVSRYMLSPYLTDLSWVIFLSLIPTVLLLAYFHGRRKTSKWTQVERIGLPLNAVLTILLLVFIFKGKDLGAVTTTVTMENEEGEKIERIVLKSEFRKKAALFFFNNESKNPEYDWLQYCITIMTGYDLSQDIFIEPATAFGFIEKLKGAGFDDGLDIPLTLMKKVAGYYHMNYFLTGSFDVRDNQFIIYTKLFETERGKLLAERTFSGEDIFALIDEITVTLKQDLEIPENHIESTQDLPVAEILTSSENALINYSEGFVKNAIENDYSRGIDLIGKAVQEDPGFAMANLVLAEFYFNNNQIENATTSLQSTRDNIYKLPERLQFVTKYFYYVIKQEADKSLAILKMWVELFPDDLQGRSMLAARYYVKNQIMEAINEYKTIISIDPEKYDHLITVGDLYKKLGIFDSALVYYQSYATHFPEDHKSYQNIGDLLMTTGEFAVAKENYEKALLRELGKISIMINLAKVELRTGNFDEALSGYNEALSICKSANDKSKVFNALSSYYEITGQSQNSLDYFKKKIKEIEKYVQSLHVMVNQVFHIGKYINAGKEKEAFDLLNKIKSELEPPLDKVASYGFLFAYLELDDADNAEKMIPKAEQLAKGFGQESLLVNIIYAWGRIYQIRGEYEKAIENYKEFFELQPTSYAMNRNIAECYRNLNQPDMAEKHILEALKYYPYRPKINYEAALIYLDKGEKEKALKYLKLANEIWKDADPGYKPAQMAKAKFEELVIE
ncbi:MAG: tetratricopeptide repeat protein [Bacteroidales bacterium]|nr:tetratricopeptide repeat protein [Bacteroidales bacterium]